ncbi:MULTISPECIES: sugar ABC transporter substrate-binding protein [unclassified Streptomyces]|uniref:ABC transporter substrate-binding protein n=1 Tax=unclassified Streptomyces TaxID=2593676 RepID=UPI002ED614B5|nr:sugar ABC transporter substrate-binding protein [Streptomyces sp. NBC_00891]WSY04318.1 sugar ABC transporter substrate-binding protein [Streptomyces sp. NBC_00890]WSZ05943.1 sugar ABC transporter substrate-binding protein [Streptomyces sp. NBC_00869]WSZ26561.1 sugar ABC transporter substrate-binding protein [Streptomyces sp. NBC_00870]
MKKNLAAVGPLAVAACLVLSACDASGTSDTASSDGRTVVKIALWNYKSTPEFKALIDGFEAENPKIHIQPVDILADSYPDKITTMLAGGDTTDILTMKNVTDYARYATRGQLKPLTDAVGKLDKASYSGLDDYNLKDQYYALPYRSDFWVLFYNKAMVGKTDLSKLTWDDYAKLAKQLTKGSGSDKVYGTYLHTWRSVVQAIASAQTGGDQLGGDYGFFKKQYDMVLDLQKSKATLPFSTASTQQITYDSQLTTGKAAMVPMGSWWAAALLAEKAQGKNDIDWGMAPMPQTTAGGETVTFGSPTAFAVNKKARHAAEAEKFVTWAAGPEGAAAVAKIGVTPAYTSDKILDTFFSVDGMPDDALSRKAMEPGKVQLEMPVSDKSSDIDQILKEEHEMIMSGEKSVDSGIKEMNDRVRNEVR